MDMTRLRSVSINLSLQTLGIVAVNLLNLAVNAIAMHWLGRLGSAELEASTINTGIYSFLYMAAFFYVMPMSFSIAKEYGARTLPQIGLLLKRNLLLTTLIGLAFFLFIYQLPLMLSKWSLSGAVFSVLVDYFQVMSFNMLPLLWLLAFSQFFIGVSRVLPLLLITLAMVPIHLCLAYGLLFGKFYLPNCGVTGAALAAIFATSLNLLVLLLYAYFNEAIRASLSSVFDKRKFIIAYPLVFKWPDLLRKMATVIAFILLISIVARMPRVSISILAQPVALQWVMSGIVLLLSCMQSCSVSTIQALAANQGKDAKITGYFAIFIVGFCLCMVGFFFWHAPLLYFIFYIYPGDSYHQQIVTQLSWLLLLAGVMQNVNIISFTLLGLEKPLNVKRIFLATNRFSVWLISIPVAYFLSVHGHWNAVGLVAGYLIGVTIAMGINLSLV